MQRGGYDHIPNRILSSHVPILDNNQLRRSEYEQRLGRDPYASSATARQPLLGNAPMDYSAYSRAQSFSPAVYNGPVLASEPARRRGFDKGPFGEELVPSRYESRLPLMRTPGLAVERIGGDMEIARSRSVSPDARLVSARSVRDDRKRDRTRTRRSRTRSRSRSRSRDRDRDRSSRDRPRRDKEREKQGDVGNMPVRDGIVYTNDNYYEFLAFFVRLLNDEIQGETDRAVQGQRKLSENVTRASDLEKQKIILPPDFKPSDRERMLHCDTTIEGLPAAIFFGSGYGARTHYAKYSAAKDLVDKCHRIGVINSDLHAVIGERPRLDRTFQKQYALQISKAVHAVILLIKKMSQEILPPGFMTLRHLDPDIIDRFKHILRMVMIDVYYQGINAPVNIPKALEIAPDAPEKERRRVDSERSVKVENVVDIDDRISTRKRPEDVLALREKELKEQMERELVKKRQEMEQEIRQKILEEERSKIRAELEMEKKIEAMMVQQQQYEKEKQQKEEEEHERKNMMLKTVETEFNTMVGQLEQRFVEIREKNLSHILDMIYASSTFKTIQLYSSTLTSLSMEQKQQLVIDLKTLLDCISRSIESANRPPGVVHLGNSQAAYSMPSHMPSPVPAPLPLSSSTRGETVHRITVGDIRLRVLSSSEQRKLTTGNKVIAQDMKSGAWNLATVVIAREGIATLTVGNETWRKNLNELYIEDKSSKY
uniref:Uncharacterized protein n=1 Tax=Caenorhabditis japonica TaxID=281687 RepID=A0A8R1HKJ7_CAEJA